MGKTCSKISRKNLQGIFRLSKFISQDKNLKTRKSVTALYVTGVIYNIMKKWYIFGISSGLEISRNIYRNKIITIILNTKLYRLFITKSIGVVFTLSRDLAFTSQTRSIVCWYLGERSYLITLLSTRLVSQILRYLKFSRKNKSIAVK